jgi:hypothetical protein
MLLLEGSVGNDDDDAVTLAAGIIKVGGGDVNGREQEQDSRNNDTATFTVSVCVS